jgi:long-subunit acyl-CoA synthetase (AMP-forming)
VLLLTLLISNKMEHCASKNLCVDVLTFQQEGGEALHGPHTLVLFEDTCAAWTLAALGALGESIAIVTCYATLGAGAVAEVVEVPRRKIMYLFRANRSLLI